MWFIHWCSCAEWKTSFKRKFHGRPSFFVMCMLVPCPGVSWIICRVFQADQHVCPMLRILRTASVDPDIQMPSDVCHQSPVTRRNAMLAGIGRKEIAWPWWQQKLYYPHYPSLWYYDIMPQYIEDDHNPWSGNPVHDRHKATDGGPLD